jgi:hypothetical protein
VGAVVPEVGRSDDEVIEFVPPRELDVQSKLLIVVAHGVRCPVMRQNYPAFVRLYESYRAKGIGIHFVNGVPQDAPEDILLERERYKLPAIQRDETQKILRSLKLSTVGEAVLLERVKKEGWIVRYRGGISDRVNFDYVLDKPKNEFLKEAIEDRLAGRSVRNKSGSVFGCSISFR